MSRGGAKTKRLDGPERRCIVSGESEPASKLIRFVVDPQDQVVPDVMGKLPGRGCWVSATTAALQTAVSKKLFARGLKQAVRIPDGLVGEVERQLAGRLVELLSLARKSGQAVAGYEKVKDMLMREDALVLVQAVDGSGRGKSKLSTPYKGHYIGCLTADELGMAFGRQTVIHAALTSGGLAQRVVEEAHRLRGLRETHGGLDRREGKRAE